MAQLLVLNPPPLVVAAAGTYLDVLRTHGRMHVPLTATDLFAGALNSWR